MLMTWKREMKAKVSRGSGFRGVLNYVFDMGKQVTLAKNAERVGGNMAGNDPRELSREFSVVRQLRLDIVKPVWHCSLTLPVDERLSAERWEVVAADFMQRMGFDCINTPWVAVRHCDTDKDHIHIVASRVGLDGKVWLGRWEARRAIEATQELERTHGLTLTPGLGDVRAERRKLTGKEINMAVRTGKEPPRQRLQRLLDDAVKDKPTALELAERLQAAGVNVRVNIASTTGRMNGFSFELGGVPFKGSDLGKGYAWAGLQKAGVTYDENRDRAGLERFRPAVANHRERQDVAAGRESDARRPEGPAVRSFGRDCTSIGAADLAPAGCDTGSGGLRQGNGASAQDIRRIDAADECERGAGVRAEGRETGRDHLRHVAQPVRAEIEPRQHRADYTANDDATRQADERAAEHDQGCRQTEQSSERGASASMVANVRTNSSRDRGRDVSGDWASRFKQASAAKRRAANGRLGQHDLEQGNTQRTQVIEKDRQSARELDPTTYLEVNGYTVKREGQHLSVWTSGDEVYRFTRHRDGRWLWCDRYGNNGGDNIDLVREIEPGTGYAEAVYRLSGAPTVCQRPRPSESKRQPPRLPVQGLAAREHGRDYLKKARGITPATIEHAEKTGMVRYADGSVLFVGYDRAGTAQNVTRRAIVLADPVQKRDLRGSIKSYPPILPGNWTKVWIVEGGLDALALHDIAKRNRQQPPTVIVSGGANVRSFLENADVQAILKRAERVTIAGENEKNPDAQAKADAGHQKQAQRVAEITGREVRQWTPRPEQGKDLADMNARQVAKIEAEAERARNQELSRRNQGHDGPSFGITD